MENQLEERIRRFTADEVLRMVEVGIIGDDERLELLDGELVEVSPQGPPHAGTTTLLAELMKAAYGDAFRIREAKPVMAGVDALPEPDLAIVRGGVREFLSRHPRAEECTLLIECARTSQRTDRRKAGIYAAAGAPVYWLLDLAARRLEVHSDPQIDGRYALVQLLDEDASISPPGTQTTLLVRDLLP